MNITHTFRIPYERDLYYQLKIKQLEAAKVWNDILRYANTHYRFFKKWISKGELESYTKNTYDLSAQTVQAIVAKYEQNRQATIELRKNNKKIKYPWKFKRFFCVPYKQASLEIQENKIILKNSNYSDSISLISLTAMMDKKRKSKKDKALYEAIPKKKEYIEIPNLADEDISNVSYAEIVYKHGSYWFRYSVEVPEEELLSTQKVAGGDLGEIHAITVATEDQALIISGRAIRSIKQFRAKALAELAKKMSRCKKYSNQWKKYNRAKKRLMAKSKQQLEYLYHKSTKEVMDFLVNEKVTDFVVGNPKGIEKNTKKNEKKKQKNTKSRRQQLSTWSYGKFKTYLTYKAQLKGITLHFVNEAYTSQDCPFCGGRHKANGRNFRCSVHNTERHRDVNGAQNIARKLFVIELKDVQIRFKQPIWLKRHLEKRSIKVSPI